MNYLVAIESALDRLKNSGYADANKLEFNIMDLTLVSLLTLQCSPKWRSNKHPGFTSISPPWKTASVPQFSNIHLAWQSYIQCQRLLASWHEHSPTPCKGQSSQAFKLSFIKKRLKYEWDRISTITTGSTKKQSAFRHSLWCWLLSVTLTYAKNNKQIIPAITEITLEKHTAKPYSNSNKLLITF